MATDKNANDNHLPSTTSTSAPPERLKHGQHVSALIARLLSHFWTADDHPAARTAQLEDWIDDLAEFDADTIRFACQEWRRTQTRRPTPAQIRDLAMQDRAWRESHKRTMLPEPVEHEVAADEIAAQNWRYRVAAAYRWAHDNGNTMPAGIPENDPRVVALVAAHERENG